MKLCQTMLPLIALVARWPRRPAPGARSYQRGREEEELAHWDLAVMKYAKAVELDPTNTQYKAALGAGESIKASQFHFEKGKMYRASGQPELAVVELEQAVILDPTNKYAETELRKAREDAAKVIAERNGETRMETAKKKTRGSGRARRMLEPASDRPINLNFPQPKPIKQIYRALARRRGDQRHLRPAAEGRQRLDRPDDIEFQKALETLMRQENHFYKVIDEHTILIAADTPQNRKTYEDLVIRTSSSPTADVTEVANALRSLLQTTRISVNKAENSDHPARHRRQGRRSPRGSSSRTTSSSPRSSSTSSCSRSTRTRLRTSACCSPPTPIAATIPSPGRR